MIARFLQDLAACDPKAITAAAVAIVVGYGIHWALQVWHAARQERREMGRRKFQPIKPAIPVDVARHLRSLP